ncbi:D-serine dehydratase-like isoform X2 [Physella acuta]|nr:D-serine dehydratase-like isoform X2 [Physella acuta]XP_059161743.1 D-serine dehydratase-like isoform X2 [Physella acuta]XP_059161744.1 D-serine dehydratase-like isoform X2 [Physella acuta]
MTEMNIKISELSTPCFLVDIDKVKENCQHMIDTCKKLNLQLRPHTKTHKTIEGAILQTDGAKRCIAVSTLAEAEFYADNGFDDILLAYPITKDKIKRCLNLVAKLETFHVMVSGMEGLKCLEDNIQNLPDGKIWSLVLEVDAGYGRTGFSYDGEELIDAALRVKNSQRMRLEKLYLHCGDSYRLKTISEKQESQKTNINTLTALEKVLAEKGITCTSGVGSTPNCSLPVQENSQLTEFHPGNYIFYDYMQYLFGSCRESNIACKVMTRVIAHKPEKNLFLVDCGFLALGHDGKNERFPLDFCLIQGESNLRFVDMSQEIGKITAKEGDLNFSLYPIGTIFYLLPYHSCCTSALHSVYYVHSGDEVVATWKPVRGW